LNLFTAVKKKDYRFLTAIVLISAILAGIMTEHLLYRISAEKVENVLSEYSLTISTYDSQSADILRYILNAELKKYILMIVLSFSVVGIISNLLMLFVSVYRYIFLLTAVWRSGIGSSYVLCVSAVLLSLLFLVPTFLYCIRLSYYSYFNCKENRTKLWHCTKYQLQTELKMGIIMLVYIALGAVVQSFVCTGLFERMFQ